MRNRLKVWLYYIRADNIFLLINHKNFVCTCFSEILSLKRLRHPLAAMRHCIFQLIIACNWLKLSNYRLIWPRAIIFQNDWLPCIARACFLWKIPSILHNKWSKSKNLKTFYIDNQDKNMAKKWKPSSIPNFSHYKE